MTYTNYLIVGAVTMSGVFAGSVTTLAWNRVRAWTTMPDDLFVQDFDQTIRVADKFQPALLVAALVFMIGVTLTTHGTAQALSIVSIGAQLLILLLSVTILVPLQRRLIAAHRNKAADITTLHAMRARWCTGHIGRSIVSVVMLLVVVVTACVALV